MLIIIGIITFMVGFKPFQNIVSKYKIKGRERDFLYIGINFVFAFAVVLGKVQRANSWDIFIDLPKVIGGIQATITSSELLFYVLLFGVITNIIYFSLRGVFSKKTLINKKRRAKKR